MHYEEPTVGSLPIIRDAIGRGDFQGAAEFVVGLSLECASLADALDACLEAARNTNENLRGNAILGLGHLARRFRRLERSRVEPLISAGLSDTSEYVRGHAQAAADDIAFFLGWQIEPDTPP